MIGPFGRLLTVCGLLLALIAVSQTSQASARKYVPSFSAVKRDKGPVFREGCLIYTNRVTSPPCRYGDVGSDRKVTVLGDSHALQWTPALIEIAEQRGWELTMLLRANCTAALVNISRPCNRWRQNALKRIRKEKPRLVFVASNTAPNTFVIHKGRRLGRAASEPHFRRGMIRSLRRLRQTGAEVTVMRDLPMSRGFLPSVCVSQNRSRPGKCTFRAARPASQAYDLAAARQVSKGRIIDPLPRVCPKLRCKAVAGNILKYRDRGHISATYSRTLTGWLSGKLQNPFLP